MKKILYSFTVCMLLLVSAIAQIDAGLFRYPDVSKTQLVFSYANDIWVMPKTGGVAYKISSPPGVESFPKFSPDGKTIAFTGNYDGNDDVYTIPVTGGVPVRITRHGNPDRVVDWTNDGKRVLFASIRESGKYRFNQFYTIASTGGPAEKLPLAYAEFGSYSPDGKQLALTIISQAFMNWKRYRGGWHADIHIFNLDTKTSQNISGTNEAGEEFPMWHENYIYFLSDRGPELRMNLWRYNTTTKAVEQLTKFTDYDVHFPSMGPDDIVFEAGGKLYLFNFASQQAQPVSVTVVTDNALLKPKVEVVEKYVQHASISPDGNRVLVEARGELFSVPAENGFIQNLTQSSGVAERYPSWSPDGKTIAYWSDQSGEYELWLMQASAPATAKKVTSYGAGFRYELFWSPDSKKLVFIDKAGKIKLHDVTTSQTVDVDQGLRYTEDNFANFSCSWSSDSRWLAYQRDLDNLHNAIFIYDVQVKKTQQVTNGFYSYSNPEFDPDGKYLYATTTQTFQPYYSDFDNSFIYANSSSLVAISLQKNTPSLLAPKNDTVAIKKEEEKPDTSKASSKTKSKKEKSKPEEEEKKPGIPPVVIDFDGLEQRVALLPGKAGNLAKLSAVKGKIIYMRSPNTGSDDESSASLKYYDTEKREEKTIVDAVDNYQLSADREKLLVIKGGQYAVVTPNEGQKLEKPLRLGELVMTIDPVKEWNQIFTDAWRLERDFFYDPNMHGLNWNQVKERYQKMIDGARTREEVDFVLGEMIGELSASHTYHGGGDIETERSQQFGYLGVDWEAAGNFYKIKRILRGAVWDVEAQSPLNAPGVAIKEGDYILAVNGLPLTTVQEPYAVFQGLAGKTIELTYNSTPSWEGAKKAVVQAMDAEYRLRNLAWIESMRKRVEEATNGEVGYIYVPSTGTDGQMELLRQLSAQVDKKALIIDERFNDGGQIPDRFVELLNRAPVAYWATRDGKPWAWPPAAHFGPKVMLINGWSGSGGDAFPDYFRKAGLGPLIGGRTWGGLIGLSGGPSLIDGGVVTVPTFRMYNIDGSWFKEGHGVDPDIAVPEDLAAMAKGIDPQLERAIVEIKNLIKTKGYTPPVQPGYEKR